MPNVSPLCARKRTFPFDPSLRIHTVDSLAGRQRLVQQGESLSFSAATTSTGRCSTSRIEVVRVMNGHQDIDVGGMRDAYAESVVRAPPTTRSSRWIISARPLMPRIAITSGEERPLIFS